MKKFVIALAALAAVSTASFAASGPVKFEGDHAFVLPATDTKAKNAVYTSVSPLMAVESGKGHGNYLSAIDENTDAHGFSR